MAFASLTIRGMQSEECVRTIRDALAELRGVERIFVEMDHATFSFDHTMVSFEEIRRVLTGLGYRVV
ncbi:MAG: heavy-metal-associated domain-containing protein [Nitrospirota bacterium]|jgi:copper chaperone CopZ